MLRSQAIKVAQTSSKGGLQICSTRPGRNYTTTTPPPPGQPAPNPKAADKSDNTLFYTGLGLATAAGAYYYFRSSDEPAHLEKKAREDEQRIRVNSRQAIDATRDRIDDSIQKGHAKVDQVGSVSKDKYNTAKAQIQVAAQDSKAEGRGLLDKAEHELAHANKSTKEGLAQTRDTTEELYRRIRDSTEQKSSELRADADRNVQDVKEGWFSWLGYGKSKVEDAGNAAREAHRKLDSEAEQLRKEAAKNVARAAEDVRVKADKHA